MYTFIFACSLAFSQISIHFDRIEEVAKEIAVTRNIKPADWKEVLPSGLSIQEQIEFIVGLISIDFCHWEIGERGFRDFYAFDEVGSRVRGSAAMTALAKRAYNLGIKLFDAPFMSAVTVEELRGIFTGFDADEKPMTIPWLEERVRVLNEIGRILLEKWDGSFYHLYLASKQRVYHEGSGFLELLVRDFPRYRDEYGTTKIYKLAQLTVMALESVLNGAFQDCETLTVCADYQLPKSLRALGILEYSPELASYVDQERLIPAGSSFEIELRVSTILAAESLKNAVNRLLGEVTISSQEIDYFLWVYGRALDRNIHKHHLTKTIMY